MVRLVHSELRSDATMWFIFQHSADDVVRLERLGVSYLLRRCPWVFTVRSRAGDLGGRETLVTFPVCNVVQVRLGDGWREFFFVNRDYGTGVRDCVRLGAEAWLSGAKREAEVAFVSRLPKGVENGVEVNGLHLFEAEWMMPGAVAVG